MTAAAGRSRRGHAYGLGPNAVLDEMDVAAGTRETLVPDVQGSIIASLDSGTGTLTKIGYQAYGEHPGLTSGSYRYTAQRFDPETAGSSAEPSGLYDYRARIYSPTLGRFLQPDPAGYVAGTNLYAYVNNDPVNGTDSSGLAPDDPTLSGGGGSNYSQPSEASATAPIENQSSGGNGATLAASDSTPTLTAVGSPITVSLPAQSTSFIPSPSTQEGVFQNNQSGTPIEGIQIAAAGDLKCQGFSGGCQSGGSYGATAMYGVSGRVLCTDCTVKILGSGPINLLAEMAND